MSEAFAVSYAVLWVLTLAIAVGLLALYRHFGEMYLTSREGRVTQGPEIDAPLPSVSAEPVDGTRIQIPVSGVASLLLFAAADCALCKRLLPEAMALDSDELRVVVIFSGRRDDLKSALGTPNTDIPIVIDPTRKLTVHYGVGVTPFAVAVDVHGVVRASGIVNDIAAIRYIAAAVDFNSVDEFATARGGAG